LATTQKAFESGAYAKNKKKSAWCDPNADVVGYISNNNNNNNSNCNVKKCFNANCQRLLLHPPQQQQQPEQQQ